MCIQYKHRSRAHGTFELTETTVREGKVSKLRLYSCEQFNVSIGLRGPVAQPQRIDPESGKRRESLPRVVALRPAEEGA